MHDQDGKDVFQEVVKKKQDALKAKRERLRKYSKFSQDEDARKNMPHIVEHGAKVRRASALGVPMLIHQVLMPV